MRFNLKKGREYGSLTVEACIVLPVFLCFFYLLLFFVKLAVVNIVLDHAVKETAQQIAAVSYPLGLANEYLDSNFDMDNAGIFDEFMKAEIPKPGSLTDSETSQNLLTRILTGQIEKTDLEELFREIQRSVTGNVDKDTNNFGKGTNNFENGSEAIIYKKVLPSYIAIKTRGIRYVFSQIYEKYIENTSIEKGRLKYILIELPQGYAEYEYKKGAQFYRNTGLKPSVDFNNNDVVIEVDYSFKIPLPYFGKKDIVMRHTAVERAWLAGGNGIYAADKSEERLELLDDKDDSEGDKSEEGTGGDNGDSNDKQDEETLVYVCKSDTGVYHTMRDCDYIRGRRIRIMTLDEARDRGKRAHSGCPYRFE
jgi:hypothetical protein